MDSEDITSCKIIDWNLTLENVGDDREFLYEIMNDLFFEANECYQKIMVGLLKNDYKSIFEAAHRIKGTALYLSCDQLSICAKEIEILAKYVFENNMTDTQKHSISANIRKSLAEYNDSLDRLRDEFTHFDKHK
jgi:HPt (histidine-containing phosphotransfer) domain-containing protein